MLILAKKKYFRAAMIIMSKESKETIIKELKEDLMMVFHQM